MKLEESMIYDSDGWVNFDYIMSFPYTFIVTVGGRGIGKTYGGLKWIWQNVDKSVYMRRTGTQLDTIKSTQLHPLYKLQTDGLLEFNNEPIVKNVMGSYDTNGKCRIYNTALSLISSIRGVDYSDVKFVFYDEYIKETHEKSIRGEYKAFCNTYETINRNRELIGESPVRVLLCSNSEDIFNPILDGLNVVNDFVNMQKNNESIKAIENRSILLINFRNSPISERKNKTAVSSLLNSEIQGIMTGNNFIIPEVPIDIKPFIELVPICTVCTLTFYRNKGNRKIYCYDKTVKGIDTYNSYDIYRFARRYQNIIEAYNDNKIIYDSYGTFVRLKTILKEG